MEITRACQNVPDIIKLQVYISGGIHLLNATNVLEKFEAVYSLLYLNVFICFTMHKGKLSSFNALSPVFFLFLFFYPLDGSQNL